MKRFLSATPSELVAMTPAELLAAIKMSEGRILQVAARIRGSILIDGVTNAELAAAFGADIINIDTYDIFRPNIPGWHSKDKALDQESMEKVQVPLGYGYNIQEISEIVGRPLAMLMIVCDPEDIKATEECYGKGIVATAERIIEARKLGAKYIMITGWARKESFVTLFQRVRAELGDDLILHFGRPHGPGILNKSRNSDELITEEEVISLIRSGVNIIGIPSPGTFPGWDLEKCKRFVNLIHKEDALASLGCHTSQEGALTQTIEQIALLAKMAGADMHELGDAAYSEQVADPMNVMHYSLVIRGRRHTYRRMAISIKR